jgi:hypothetical protein
VKSHWKGRIYEGFAPTGDVIYGPGEEVSDPTVSSPCELHAEWRPARWLETQPMQSAEECPYCQRARLERRRSHPTAYEPEVHPNPRTSTFGFGQDTERVQKALDAHAGREANRPGHVVPGSPEESRALEIIQNRRDEDRDADRRRSGRVVIERIEGGDVVRYVVPHHGRGLIRRGP